MIQNIRSSGIGIVLGLIITLMFAPQGIAAEKPVYGGHFPYIVSASNFPSMDAHREVTFAVVQPLAPFYSLLIKVNPENPSDPTDFVGDLAESWSANKDETVWTFKLRKNVKFHDGSLMTSKDVKASFDKVIFPPEGVISSWKGYFPMVEAVEAPDDFTVVFKLKFGTKAFIPAVATPYLWIYKADILAKDMHWYEKNVMGTGAFKFKDHVAGSHVEGVKNPDYFIKGRPYLDSFRAIFINKQAPQVAAIRGGRALINFRAFPPKTRDDLVKALGDKITVQESPWNCVLIVTPNHKVKPFDDPRVRRALSLALDRWEASKTLSKIAIAKPVGGCVFPHHPLGLTDEELQQNIAGYSLDIEASRKEARRLLKEAGVPEGFKIKFHNRGVEQPYKVLGIWVIDQWRKIGLDVEHWVQPTAQFYATLRAKKQAYAVSMDFNCRGVVNPLLDITKFLSDDIVGNQYAEYQDRVLDELHGKIMKEIDPVKLKKLLFQFEKRVLDEEAHQLITLWWNRIVPHHSRLKGWKISPSHYLNQDLVDVWLAKE